MDTTRFTGVVLRPRVSFEEDPTDLHHRAHERCYIANSVSCPVVIESRPF